MHTKHIYLMLLIVGCVAVFAACAKVSIPVANGTATATVPTFLSKQSSSFKKTTNDGTTTNTLSADYARDTNADAAEALKTAASALSTAAAAMEAK